MNVTKTLPVMRLIGWCKNIDRKCTARFPNVFKPSLMRSLVRSGLLRPYSETYGWRVSPDGYNWLAAHGYPLQPDKHTQRAKRRFDNASVVLTMHAAGISPFIDSMQDLQAENGYLPAFALRARQGQHLLGSNQTVGFLRLGPQILAAYYPDTDRQVVIQREYNCAQTAMLRSGCNEMGFLFCGESYASIYRTLLDEHSTSATAKKTSYAQLYAQSGCAFLLPCNLDGALQLRMMRIPDYRRKLSAMLGDHADCMAQHGLPDCDFIDRTYHMPAHIIADMELRHVSLAALQSKAAGYDGVILASLGSQEHFLSQLFPPPFFHIAIIPEEAVFALEEETVHASPI